MIPISERPEPEVPQLQRERERRETLDPVGTAKFERTRIIGETGDHGHRRGICVHVMMTSTYNVKVEGYLHQEKTIKLKLTLPGQKVEPGKKFPILHCTEPSLSLHTLRYDRICSSQQPPSAN